MNGLDGQWGASSADATGAASVVDSVIASNVASNASAGAADAAPALLERMGFRVGDFALLLPAQSAREIVLAPATSRLPNTAVWLLGLANVRGNIVPVVDTALALGTARDSSLPAYALVLGQSDASIALLIDGLPRLLNIETSVTATADVVMPAILEGAVLATYTHGGRQWLDLDRGRLLDGLARSIAL